MLLSIHESSSCWYCFQFINSRDLIADFSQLPIQICNLKLVLLCILWLKSRLKLKSRTYWNKAFDFFYYAANIPHSPAQLPTAEIVHIKILSFLFKTIRSHLSNERFVMNTIYCDAMKYHKLGDNLDEITRII